MQENNLVKKPHNIILQERKDLSVSGVVEVISFDDESIVINTSMGELTINGENLHVCKTNVETGELIVNGEICECIYSVNKKNKSEQGLFKNIFGRN